MAAFELTVQRAVHGYHAYKEVTLATAIGEVFVFYLESNSVSKTMNWIRCLIGFALLRTTIMYLRGSRSSSNHMITSNVADCPMDVTICEGKT